MRDFAQDFFDFSPTVYLNCAYHGPFPRVTVERIRQAIELKTNPARMESHHFFETTRSVRQRLAELVGASPSEIALTNSATQGIGMITSGLNWQSGDEVVIAGNNFPSNLFSWINLRRLGVGVKPVKPTEGHLRPEDVAGALTSRTRVLALDWVSYLTGVRIDLAVFGELAHRRGALFVVDGTQGVGALELDVHGLPVDVLAVAAYKWLLGPYSTAFAYLTPAVRERLELRVVNWLSAEGSETFDDLPVEEFTLPKSAAIFDVPATANFLNLYALDASLEYVQHAGVKTVSAHCTKLLEKLGEGVLGRGLRLSAAWAPQRRSTILCFQADSLEATTRLFQKLTAARIAVSLRHGMIRVSPYLFNSEDDIERLLAEL